MPIRTRRFNDPREEDDGFRLLVCRFRPRGVRKEDETWDAWSPELGPSRELHAAVYGKTGPPLAWADFRRRYLAEMESRGAELDAVRARLQSGETVTLLCSSACADEQRCHRLLLAGILSKPARRRRKVSEVVEPPSPPAASRPRRARRGRP